MTAHVVFILFSVTALLPFVKAFDYPPKEKREKREKDTEPRMPFVCAAWKSALSFFPH